MKENKLLSDKKITSLEADFNVVNTVTVHHAILALSIAKIFHGMKPSSIVNVTIL